YPSSQSRVPRQRLLGAKVSRFPSSPSQLRATDGPCRCVCSSVQEICVVESGRQSQTSFLFTTRVLTLSEVFDSIRFTRKDQGERNGSWLESESGIGGGSQSGNGASHRLRFWARGGGSKDLRAGRGDGGRMSRVQVS